MTDQEQLIVETVALIWKAMKETKTSRIALQRRLGITKAELNAIPDSPGTRSTRSGPCAATAVIPATYGDL